MKKLIYLFLFFASPAVFAAQPKDWQLGFQPAVTPIMRDLSWMHDYILLPIIIAISVFVLFLLIYLVVNFRAATAALATASPAAAPGAATGAKRQRSSGSAVQSPDESAQCQRGHPNHSNRAPSMAGGDDTAADGDRCGGRAHGSARAIDRRGGPTRTAAGRTAMVVGPETLADRDAACAGRRAGSTADAIGRVDADQSGLARHPQRRPPWEWPGYCAGGTRSERHRTGVVGPANAPQHRQPSGGLGAADAEPHGTAVERGGALRPSQQQPQR